VFYSVLFWYERIGMTCAFNTHTEAAVVDGRLILGKETVEVLTVLIRCAPRIFHWVVAGGGGVEFEDI
jgi:hypothetical protein